MKEIKSVPEGHSSSPKRKIDHPPGTSLGQEVDLDEEPDVFLLAKTLAFREKLAVARQENDLLLRLIRRLTPDGHNGLGGAADPYQPPTRCLGARRDGDPIMARPRKSDLERRSAQVNIRLTVNELAKLDQSAAEAGLRVGAYVREAALRGRVIAQIRKIRQPGDLRLLAALTRIGVNLNQLTRHAHGQGGISTNIAIQLDNLLTKIDTLTDRIDRHDR